MTDQAGEQPPKRPLFRPEAVEHHSRARIPGRSLELHDERVTWLFRGLLALLAVAVVLAFTIHTETAAQGSAVAGLDGRTAVVTLRGKVESETGVVSIEFEHSTETGRIVQVLPSGSLFVALDDGVRPGVPGKARVPLGRKPVVALLLGWDR